MAKAKAKTGGTTKTKTGIKAPQVVIPTEKLTGKPPRRIKMLTNLANQDAVYKKGHIYRWPRDLPKDTARSWVACGVAEKVE